LEAIYDEESRSHHREEKLNALKNFLRIGIFGMTMTEVSGRGRQKGVPLKWAPKNTGWNFCPN